MGWRIWGVALMGALATVMASTTAMAGAPAGVACCDDAKGQRVCGNPLPSECYGRKYWLVDDSGMIRKVVDPAAARAQRQEANEAGALSPQEQSLRRQQERLRQAFPTLQAFDAWRDAHLADYDRQIAQIRALIAEGGDSDALAPTLQRLLDERRAAAQRLAAERRELEEALRAGQQGE
ncbi:MAG: hypothetical protein HZA65_07895 [Rhodocyclales bacterium]|nr:hypothetical protein [Rhodocyclales bacterium]